MTEELYKKMETSNTLLLFFLVGSNPKLHRFETHKLTKDIIKHMKYKMSQKYYNSKFRGFSGHDSTILPFLLRAGVMSEECLLERLEGKNPDNC